MNVFEVIQANIRVEVDSRTKAIIEPGLSLEIIVA